MAQLRKDQVAMLQTAFDSFDSDKKGYIEGASIQTIMEMLGHKLDKKTIQEFIDECYEEGCDQLEFSEFVEFASRYIVEEDQAAMEKELKEAFRLYDREGDGYITTDVLRSILLELDDKISDDDLEGMIDEIDADGSGTVDFEEFMAVMTG